MLNKILNKTKLLLYLLFIANTCFGQINNIDKGSATVYTRGIPTPQPRIKYDSEWGINVNDAKIYRFNRNSNQWVWAGSFVGRLNSNSTPTLAPGYGEPEYVLNNQYKLFWWNSSAWVCITCSSVVTVFTDATLSGSGTLGDPLKIAQQGATSGQVLKWNGTTWLPANDENTTYTGGTKINIAGTTINNTGDLDPSNELQFIDSFWLSHDTLFISLDRDSVAAKFTKLTGLSASGGGIYGVSDTVTYHHNAKVDSGLTFSSTIDTSYLNILLGNLYGSFTSFKPDSTLIRYFDVGGSNQIILKSTGITLQTNSPDRVTVKGNDERYFADYRSTFSDRSHIDKGYGDDFYLQYVDTLRVSNDTLYMSLVRDSVPQKGVKIPQLGLDVYNLDIITPLPSVDIEGSMVLKTVDVNGSKYFYVSNGTVWLDGGLFLDTLNVATIHIGNNQVTYAKIQQVSSQKILGNSTGATANVQEIGLGTGLGFSGTDIINTSPDQTVVLTPGTGISISGSYPSFTITNTVTNTDNQTLSIDSTGQYFLLSISGGNTIMWDNNDADASTTNEIQQLDTFSISGPTISASLSLDGVPAKTLNITESVEDITGAMVSGNTETGISVTYDDGTGKLNFVATDQSTTNELQTLVIDSVSITGKERFLLEISSGNVVAFDVDLNTDEQELSIDSAIVGAVERFKVTIENGNFVYFDVPQGGSVQYVDTFDISNDSLRISLFADGKPLSKVDLSPYLDNTDEQELSIDSTSISTGERFAITISNGNTIYFDDNDHQIIDTFEIVSNILRISNQRDNQPFKSVDLSPYVNEATNLTFSGSGPVTLNSSTGTDVTFTASTGISFSSNSTNLTITNSAPDQTVVINDGTGIDVTGTYPTFTVNSTITQYTDELAQDAVGLILLDGTTIDFTYNDGTPNITAEVKSNSLSNTYLTSGTGGIYKGSGIIATAAVATVDTGSTFQFEYSNNNIGFNFADGTGVELISDDGTESISAYNGAGVEVNASMFTIASYDGISSGILRILEPAGTDYLIFKSQNMSTSRTFTWPAVYGTNGQQLTTNGSGTLSWADAGVTDLTIGGSGPTYTIESSTGTDITISTVGITLSESPTNTLVFTAVDQSITNEIQQIDTFSINAAIISASLSLDGVPAKTIDITESVQDIAGGMVTGNTETGITVTYDDSDGTFDFVTVDQSASNELQTVANTSDATSHTVTLSNSGGSYQVVEGTGIGLATTGTTLDGILTITNTGDLSTTNEIQRFDTFEIVSNVLRASLLNDGVPFSSVDLSVYLDNTDEQTLSIDSTTISNIERFSITIENGNTIYFDVMSSVLTAGMIEGDGVTTPIKLVDGTADGDVIMWNDMLNEWESVQIQISTELEGNGSISDPIKLSQQGATDGQVLTWNDGLTQWIPTTIALDDNQFLAIDSLSGVGGQHFLLSIEDGNTVTFFIPTDNKGIYGGSGEIPTGTIATVETGGSFQFNHSAITPGFTLEDGVKTEMTSPDNSSYIRVSNALSSIYSSATVAITADDELRINSEGSTGTANQVLTAVGDGTAIWADNIDEDGQTLSIDSTLVGSKERFKITISGGNDIYFDVETNAGTVTSVAATAPTEGFDISGSPITSSGTFTFTLDDDLAGLESMSGTGLVARTASNTYAQRTLQEGLAIDITNGSGVSGDPTINADTTLLATVNDINAAAPRIAFGIGPNRLGNSSSLVYETNTMHFYPSADDTLLAFIRGSRMFGVSTLTDPFNGGVNAYKFGSLPGNGRVFMEAFGFYMDAPFYQSEASGIGFMGTTGDLRLNTNGDYYTATLTGDNQALNRNITYYFTSGGGSTGKGNPVVFQQVFSNNDTLCNSFEFLARNTASGGITHPDSNLFRVGNWDRGVALNILQNRKVGIKTKIPTRELDIDGELRIRDLTTTNPTLLLAVDADGVVSQVTLGSNLSFTGTTLNATGGGSGGNGIYGDETTPGDGNGTIPPGGSVVNVDGDDPLIFNLDNGPSEVNRIIRMKSDYTDDTAYTYFLQTVTPVDSLFIYSFDSGINISYEGPSGSGTGLTISSSTQLQFQADSVTITDVPSKTKLHSIVGMYGNTLTKIVGTSDGQVLQWNNSNSNWELGTGGSSYTDEEAQDAVGSILVDDNTIDFTYSDATPSITAQVKGAFLTASPSTDLGFTGTQVTFTANENQGFGDICFINSSGKAQLGDADAISTASCVAMAMGTISSNATGTYLLMGVARNDTWNWTIGGLVYLSTTGTTTNTLTQTAPSGSSDVVQIVGVALTADIILFNPNLMQIELN